MFESWGPWTWVTLAWAELVLAYVGFVVYLRLRAKQLEGGDEPSND